MSHRREPMTDNADASGMAVLSIGIVGGLAALVLLVVPSLLPVSGHELGLYAGAVIVAGIAMLWRDD